MKKRGRRTPPGYRPLPPPAAPVQEFPIHVDRNVYPGPEHRFSKVKIGMTHETSSPDFPRPAGAPAGAPNVIVIVLDDIGYGVTSTFGGLVETPTLDRLAAAGLRYCRFHTTALSSPTCAALLTGRNHHTVGAGAMQEQATGYPGYSGIIPKSCASIGELLRQNGYATGWWGKDHNIPDSQTSAAGPFDNWPTRIGFDYFYGFIGGEADQFYPQLVRNTTPVDPRSANGDAYHLTTDLADDCIAWLRRQKEIAPARPVFAYFAPGCGHSPHQPPVSRRGRHAGRFDFGWDEYRKRVFERQLALGVVPAGTRLTPRPAEIPAWESASPDEQRLFARFFENFADYVEHADSQIGRIIDTLGEIGEIENTIIMYLAGDSGSSAEGTLAGTLNDVQALNGYHEGTDALLPRIDAIGKPGTSPHYPVGWAWAGNTPFQWTKQIASHLGGTRNGLVLHWPERIREANGRRYQFHHVIDVVPTILEAIGIAPPTTVNGVYQRPIEGVSMAYTFSPDGAAAETRRNIQYFETLGNRALYNDGWMACCRHGAPPWLSPRSSSFRDDVWELYHIDDDFSQSVDLALEQPAKLRELQDLFMAEAAKHNVLPLDDRTVERLDVSLHPNQFHGRRQVTFFPGMVRLPEGGGPKTNNVTHTITAKIDSAASGAEGVIVCVGGDTGGWSLYVMNKRLVYHYNFLNAARYEIVSEFEIPSGPVELKVDFYSETQEPGGPATVRLFVDGDLAGEGRIAAQVRDRFGFESLDVGVDMSSPVAEVYRDRRGFPFTGRIEHVTFEFSGSYAEVRAQERLEMLVRAD